MSDKSLEFAEKLCQNCTEIGRTLGQVSITQNAAEALEQLAGVNKLRVVIVSSNRDRAMAAAEEILGTDVSSAVLKCGRQNSACIRFVLGDANNEKKIESESGDEPLRLTCQCSNELLQKMELAVYISSHSFTDFNWKMELTPVDFVFMTFSAIQMLTQSERNFLQSCVKKYVGGPRFAAILADTEAINSEEDYKELGRRLTMYFVSQGMNTEYYELGTNSLCPFVVDQLLDEAETLHRLAAEQVASLCCEETQEKLEGLLNEANGDEATLADALDKLKKRTDQMHRSGRIAANWGYSEVSGVMTYNATQSIHRFLGQLDEEMTQTIEDSNNVQKTLALVPDFVDNALRSYKGNLEKALAADANDLGKRLMERMREDAGEFLGDSIDGLDEVVAELIGAASPKWQSAESKITLKKNKKKQQVENLSKVLLIGTLPVFILSSFVGVAGMLMASQAVKRFAANEVEAEDKANAIGAIHTLCSNLEQELTIETKNELIQVAAQVQKKVEGSYDGFVAAVTATVEEKMVAIAEAKKQREKIEEMIKKLESVRKQSPVEEE